MTRRSIIIKQHGVGVVNIHGFLPENVLFFGIFFVVRVTIVAFFVFQLFFLFIFF